MLGENGLTCGIRLMILCDATSITASSGVKLEHTNAYLPSGPNMVIPGTVRHFDAANFLHSDGINYRDVVFAAHRHPQLASVRSEECFMRRTAHVNHAFNFVRRGVDQSDGIRSHRDNSQRLGIGRVTESVNKKLPFVERTQRSWYRIAKSYNTK